MKFTDKLSNISQRNDSLLCIGLDPDPLLMPTGVTVPEFNKAIIDATADLVCAYKPNFAFYEVLGEEGPEALRQTIKLVPPEIPVIADAKRNDIGNTAKAYARAIFEYYGCDAATVNPYLGFDSVEPFLNYQDRGVFILCRTSNPGAADFQSLICNIQTEPRRLYEFVAEKAAEWNKYSNIGLVVGATYPEELVNVRQQHPEMLLLIPGVGSQGGDLNTVVRKGVDKRGAGIIINSSRQVLYAAKGSDFAFAARKVASTIREQINRIRRGYA